MSDRTEPQQIWIVDPINYSGMAYYDAGLAGGLAAAGARVTVAGSDVPLVGPPAAGRWHLEPVFAGTGPTRSRWRRAASYAAAIVRILYAIRRQRPDWVIWNYIEQPWLDGLAIRGARRLGSRVAFVAHEVTPWEVDTARHGLYRRLMTGGADAIVVHGSRNADELRSTWGIPDERVIVGEHGDYREWIDASASQTGARERLGLPVEAPVALFFGTLRMSKGLEVLLDAWPMVHQRLPAARLVVAGRPYRGTDLSKLDRSLGGLVVRAQAIDPDEANDYYCASDLVVIPYDRVSTSGVMRYAYSASRPVLATRVGELQDHVIPGTTGRLVRPGDAPALADALTDMLSELPETAAMGARAKAYADADFDWTAAAASLQRELALRSRQKRVDHDGR